MNKITIFNTCIASSNIGDRIIVDAVKKQLVKIFYDTMYFDIPTHERLGYKSYRILNNCNVAFIAGTNLLNSKHRLLLPNSWRYSFKDSLLTDNNKNVLMGVGWGKYQSNPSLLTKVYYNSSLSKKFSHSVRDNYTKIMLNEAGFYNVINTGCPTMWDLTPEFCSQIKSVKSENVIFTLTDYNKDEEKDRRMISILIKNYKNVFFWPQGSLDIDYFFSFNINGINIINPTLEGFDFYLENSDTDYIGTRLHGGIRALQHKKRTIIIGIDNRALEKNKDFNLNVLERSKIDDLEYIINSRFSTDINLDLQAIEKWKDQFRQ